MIILRHKKNGNEYPVTPEAFDKIKANPNWPAAYEVVQCPPAVPKEIVGKAQKAQKPAESATHNGIEGTDAQVSSSDAGQEQ